MDKRWTTLLTNLCPRQSLEQGLRYASQGQVLSMDLLENRIMGRVQGRRGRPYRVEIRIKPFPSEIWDIVITTLAQQATLAAAVIDGAMPKDVEKSFQKAGVCLFPQSPKEFAAECSCIDNANPCKHIIAVFCILAQEFVKNPFTIFMLRGKSQDALLTDLINKRTAIQQNSTTAFPEALLTAEPLSAEERSEIIRNYWLPVVKLDDIDLNEETPSANCTVLQLLGNPPDWPCSHSLAEIMQPLYEHVSKTNR